MSTPALRAGEFTVSADAKLNYVVTTRRIARPLAHESASAVMVWRRTGSQPAQPSRLMARTLCGEWITSARVLPMAGIWARCPACDGVLNRRLRERIASGEADF